MKLDLSHKGLLDLEPTIHTDIYKYKLKCTDKNRSHRIPKTKNKTFFPLTALKHKHFNFEQRCKNSKPLPEPLNVMLMTVTDCSSVPIHRNIEKLQKAQRSKVTEHNDLHNSGRSLRANSAQLHIPKFKI